MRKLLHRPRGHGLEHLRFLYRDAGKCRLGLEVLHLGPVVRDTLRHGHPYLARPARPACPARLQVCEAAHAAHPGFGGVHYHRLLHHALHLSDHRCVWHHVHLDHRPECRPVGRTRGNQEIVRLHDELVVDLVPVLDPGRLVQHHAQSCQRVALVLLHLHHLRADHGLCDPLAPHRHDGRAHGEPEGERGVGARAPQREGRVQGLQGL
mmetsp:Transcript_36092/g.93044  ORF Transcript_36092/g.93044 Transcript_36092/m.93044 type:complete len:208 (-) Transcript_36092:632-1255(-)